MIHAGKRDATLAYSLSALHAISRPSPEALSFVTILCHLRGEQRGEAQTAEGHL